MTFLLGECAHAVRKLQCLGKIREAKDPLQPLDSFSLNQGPFGYLGLKLSDFRLGGSGSIAAARYTFFSSECAHDSPFIDQFLVYCSGNYERTSSEAALQESLAQRA